MAEEPEVDPLYPSHRPKGQATAWWGPKPPPVKAALPAMTDPPRGIPVLPESPAEIPPPTIVPAHEDSPGPVRADGPRGLPVLEADGP